jgi:hypothetical protein
MILECNIESKKGYIYIYIYIYINVMQDILKLKSYNLAYF